MWRFSSSCDISVSATMYWQLFADEIIPDKMFRVWELMEEGKSTPMSFVAEGALCDESKGSNVLSVAVGEMKVPLLLMRMTAPVLLIALKAVVTVIRLTPRAAEISASVGNLKLGLPRFFSIIFTIYCIVFSYKYSFC